MITNQPVYQSTFQLIFSIGFIKIMSIVLMPLVIVILICLISRELRERW